MIENSIDAICMQYCNVILDRLANKNLVPSRFSKTRTEHRFGQKGSLSVNLEKAVWHDFESGEGGNLKTLISRQTNLLAKDWLFSEDFILEKNFNTIL